MKPPSRTIWIIGGGKFGLISARALRRHRPEARLTIVEIDGPTCRQLAVEAFEVVAGEAVDYLDRHLKGPEHPDWIVPVVPVHLACAWVKRCLEARGRVIAPLDVPRTLDALVVSALRGGDGTLYVSNADFTCPDNCPEPAGVCTHTGRPRPCIMHAKLAGLDLPGFTPVVVRSHQLLPGVGGYRPADLFAALDAAAAASGPVLLASACCCHGVVNAFVADDPARRS